MKKIDLEKFARDFKEIEKRAIILAIAYFSNTIHTERNAYVEINLDAATVEVRFSLGYNCGEEDEDYLFIKFSELNSDADTFVKNRREEEHLQRLKAQEVAQIKRLKEAAENKARQDAKDKAEYERLKKKFKD